MVGLPALGGGQYGGPLLLRPKPNAYTFSLKPVDKQGEKQAEIGQGKAKRYVNAGDQTSKG